MSKRSDKANDFGRYSEISRDKYGSVIGRYSTGDLGSIHQTNTHYGFGKTTLHTDGSSHHHGTHAHSGYKKSFTRDGVLSKK